MLYIAIDISTGWPGKTGRGPAVVCQGPNVLFKPQQMLVYNVVKGDLRFAGHNAMSLHGTHFQQAWSLRQDVSHSYTEHHIRCLGNLPSAVGR